jgi:hypothetical protein
MTLIGDIKNDETEEFIRGEVQFFDYEILSAREIIKKIKRDVINKATPEFESAGYSSFSTVLVASIKLV